jgi:polyisoprenoid-binding protein YceI
MTTPALIALFLAAAPLDPKASELVVKTWKVGLASALAHNHVISASEVKGTVGLDRIEVTVQVAGLAVDKPALRQKHLGETHEVSASDRNKTTDAMLGEDQLDVRKFPTITFVSTSITKEANGHAVTGQLTIHGVTKTVKTVAQISEKDGVLTGDASLKLKVSDYGIAPYSAALGSIKVKDEVELVLHLVGAAPR